MSSWLFSMYIDAVMKQVKVGMGKMGVSFLEEERELRLPGLCMWITCLCVVSWGEDLKVMLVHFIEVYRRSLKFFGKSRGGGIGV